MERNQGRAEEHVISYALDIVRSPGCGSINWTLSITLNANGIFNSSLEGYSSRLRQSSMPDTPHKAHTALPDAVPSTSHFLGLYNAYLCTTRIFALANMRCGFRHQPCSYQKEREHKRLLAKNQLPRVRPRALTTPLLANPEEPSLLSRVNPFKRISPRQKTFDQSQSPLACLPREIRDLIWTEVLGDRLLQVKRTSTKLLCPFDCTKDVENGSVICEHNNWRLVNGPRCCLLPLLKTCRMIYSEAIPILYGRNVFHFDHVDMFLYFRQSVLPQRLNQIRILYLSWETWHSFGNDERSHVLASWRKACDALASFVELQELYVFLISIEILKRVGFGSCI